MNGQLISIVSPTEKGQKIHLSKYASAYHMVELDVYGFDKPAVNDIQSHLAA